MDTSDYFDLRSKKGEQFVAALEQAYKAGKITIEPDRGHSDPEMLHDEIERLFRPNSFYPLSTEDAKEYIENIGKPCEPMYYRAMMSSFKCWKCGVGLHWKYHGDKIKLMPWWTEGEHHKLIEDDVECPYAQGEPPFTAEIDLPSGQMVIANDLRKIFSEELVYPEPKKYDPENSITYYIGKVNYVKRYEKFGMLTGFLGDGGVSVFAADDGLILSQYDDSDETSATKIFQGKKYVYRGHISLELWWFGAADLANCTKLNSDEIEKSMTRRKPFNLIAKQLAILPLTPGRYRMTHVYNTTLHDEWGGVYCKIERI